MFSAIFFSNVPLKHLWILACPGVYPYPAPIGMYDRYTIKGHPRRFIVLFGLPKNGHLGPCFFKYADD